MKTRQFIPLSAELSNQPTFGVASMVVIGTNSKEQQFSVNALCIESFPVFI